MTTGTASTFLKRLVHFASGLGRLWGHVRKVAYVLKPCRISGIVWLLGTIVFVFVPQAEEVLRAGVEESGFGGRLISYIVATTFWAVLSWYWARQLLVANYARIAQAWHVASGNKTGLDGLVDNLPRIIGTLTFASMAVACFKSSFAVGTAGLRLRILSVVFLALGGVFFLSVRYRRVIVNSIRSWVGATQDDKPLFGALPHMPAQPSQTLALAPTSLRILKISMIPTVVFLLLFVWSPETWGPSISTGPIFLTALGSWVAVGSFLDWWTIKYDIPVLLFLIVLAIGLSTINDNHRVRTLPIEGPTRETLGTRFDNWYASRELERKTSDQPIPLIIVATEGGGIRAAYWTAYVLASLHDSYPAFGRHVFAISGVSGGALGGAVFSALTANVATGTGPCVERTSLASCVDLFFEKDFLSPSVAAMLYPDLLQRFLPRILLLSDHVDRSRALESSWELGWSAITGNDRFIKPFTALWSEDSLATVPALFFTGTSVDTGKRLITASFSLAEQNGRSLFHDLNDVTTILQRPVRLSTAVHNSARFTYFSPAGALRDRTGTHRGRIVDGGYFDNSGAVLATEILASIEASDSVRWSRLRPVFLLIENETPTDNSGKRSVSFANEVLSPLRTMLRTRSARASLAKQASRSTVDADNHIVLSLRGCELKLPLGWLLSTNAREAMRNELRSSCPGSVNRASLESLGNLLEAWTTAANE